MSKTLYEAYRQQVFDLVATMVVKHSEAAEAINNDLIIKGYTVFQEPQVGDSNETDYLKTWKYYMNLAGEYHSSDFLSEDMSSSGYIEIMVAGNILPFTKEVIQNDPVLAWEYRYGTVFHTKLIEAYPDKEVLINGVLNPVDMDIAIAAKDGDILFAGDYFKRIHPLTNNSFFERRGLPVTLYNNLVEANEDVLLYDLEKWIKAFLRRYHIRDFALVDDLYLPSMLAILYMNLPAEIMNIRLSYCKTQYAHSYHIREYLQSHGQLSQYIPALTKKQALYLYRNVTWLQTNAGKQETLDDLIHNILTENNISIYEYYARLDETGFITTVMDIDDAADGTIPIVDMVRELINSVDLVGVGSDIRTIRDVLNREIPLAIQNEYDIDHVEADITEQIATSNYNELKTKILESVAIDPTERSAFRLSDVLMNEWIYCACFSIYSGKVFFTIPSTGQRLSMLAKDALILFLYVYNKGYCNIELTEVPTLGARMIPRLRSEVLADPIGDDRPLSLPYKPQIKADYNTFVDWDYIDFDIDIKPLRNTAVQEIPLPTTDEFYKYSNRVYKDLMRRWKYVVGYEHMTKRAYMEYCMVALYWDIVECQLAPPGTLYNDPSPTDGWLENMGIDLTGMLPEDYRRLADEILLNVTGMNLVSNVKLRDMHRAALQVMRQFTSYTVQFIQTTIDDAVYQAGPQPQRYGDLLWQMFGVERVPNIIVTALTQTGQMESSDILLRQTKDNIINAANELEPLSIAIDNNNALSPEEKVYEFLKAYEDKFSSKNIEGAFDYTYPEAQMQERTNIELPVLASIDGAIETTIRVLMPTMRVLEMSSDQEDLLTIVPDNILDGFNYPP